jgi:sulfopyruvate decarboxylase beta subunit
MRRYEAIEAIAGALTGRELVISANGMTSRELFSIRESASNFYMLGSMGLGSSIGFGLARSLPDRKVVIIDGDGNVLMNLGSLATIGHFAPNNLIHIVLDNEMHASTGGQPTVSNTLKLEEVARAAGFQRVRKVASMEDLRLTLREAITAGGLSFILVKIEKGEVDVPRVSYEPAFIKSRFMEAIKQSGRPS